MNRKIESLHNHKKMLVIFETLGYIFTLKKFKTKN